MNGSPIFFSEKLRLRAREKPLSGLDPLELLSRLRPDEFPVFLDSAGGPAELSRYSYIAWNPFARLNSDELPSGMNPFDALHKALKSFTFERGDVSFPFAGGAIGWLSYDLGRWIEKLPTPSAAPLTFPELFFGFYDFVIAIDHSTKKTVGILCEEIGNPKRSGESYFQQKLKELDQVLARPKNEPNFHQASKLKSDYERSAYVNAVNRAKEFIYAGDIYQVNLSQRFSTEVVSSGWHLYERLRKTNPSPYAAFFATPGGEILSSSPELFLKVRGREVETRPIKGTRPRFGDAKRDEAAKQELLASEKDRAELTMIIDLERNDLKRVCETGTVQVPRLYGIEEYETVFHLVSTVQGRLRPDVELVDVLRATFPGGSITGAPKIRAMEIITELEREARSVYTGSLGWIGFDGDAELNIAIRTILKQKNQVSYRVGGGIVVDSDPELEYEETLHKGRGLARALAVEQ